jgi:hypothetical protein
MKVPELVLIVLFLLYQRETFLLLKVTSLLKVLIYQILMMMMILSPKALLKLI